MNAEPAKPIDQVILLINALADDVARQERTLRALARAVEWYKETTEPKTPQQHQEIMDALKELKKLQQPSGISREMPLQEKMVKYPYIIDNGPSCDVSSQPAFHDPHNPDIAIEGRQEASTVISGSSVPQPRQCNAIIITPTEELYERLHEDHGA